MICETLGCGRRSQQWTVVRPDSFGSPKHTTTRVCAKCRDELMAVYGWHLLYDHGRVPDVSSGGDIDDFDAPAMFTRIGLERLVANIPSTDPLYHRDAAKGWL